MAPEPDVEEAPVPDLLGSILSSQSLLMMDSADITIHRDGSLSAKRAGEAASTLDTETHLPQRHVCSFHSGNVKEGPRPGWWFSVGFSSCSEQS